MTRLEAWLGWQIWGTRPPRKAPRKRARRGPARSWRYRAWVRSLPCLVCGSTPSEAAHTGPHGMSQKASDYSCVPLCTEHHTMAPDSYHRIGPERFAAQYRVNYTELVRRLNHDWFAYSREVK
jgi:hypothetical protein